MARDQGADEAREYEPGQPGMYELEFPAPQLSSSDGRGPVLVHALKVSPTPAMRSGWPPPTSRRPWTQSWSRPSRSMNYWTTARGGH